MNIIDVKQKAVQILVVLALFSSLIVVQNKLSTYPRPQQESLLYLPSGNHLQSLALGYDQMVADLLWINTVSYFGSHFFSDKEYPWLFHMLTLVIDLDPQFEFPYYFGGIVLSLEASQSERANAILKRATEAFPENWLYPFYIGFNLYYHLGDPLKAVPYIKQAAALEGSPAFVKRMAGTMYEKAGDEEAALVFFQTAYENTEDALVKEKITKHIEKIKAGRKK